MNQSLFHEIKDKDEIRIKSAINWIKGLTDEQKILIAKETLESVNDVIVKLWRVAWGLGHWQNMSPYQRVDTERLIKQYGYDNVRKAFMTAAEKDVKNLAYVNGVLRHEQQQEASRKEIAEAKQISDTPVTADVATKTADVLKQWRLENGIKENKYLKEKPMSKVEYIKEFGSENCDVAYREYKQNFKGV